jgi:hypothetical protein
VPPGLGPPAAGAVVDIFPNSKKNTKRKNLENEYHLLQVLGPQLSSSKKPSENRHHCHRCVCLFKKVLSLAAAAAAPSPPPPAAAVSSQFPSV